MNQFLFLNQSLRSNDYVVTFYFQPQVCLFGFSAPCDPSEKLSVSIFEKT